MANHKLKAIQQPEGYVCSQDTSEQDRKHYGLSVAAYTNFTSPLRRFISMVVQRLLVGKLPFHTFMEATYWLGYCFTQLQGLLLDKLLFHTFAEAICW